MYKLKLPLLALLLLSSFAYAQPQRRMGATMEPDEIAKAPKKIELSARSYRGMPTSASLEKWCPIPGDQGNYGTCVAFANAYGIATLLYAKSHGITDKQIITKYAFSPTFIYEQVKAAEDKNCQNGANTVKALISMAEGGDAFMKTLPYQCGATITSTARAEAANYKIKDASILFGPGEYKRPAEQMIDNTKKALLDGCPVSICFSLPESFFKIKTDVWYAVVSDTLKDWKHNSHAMAVVGFDDNKAGGAFRILNSWGTSWADKGFIWIRYADYARWCTLGLQVFGDDSYPAPPEVKPEPKPDPKPDPKPEPIPVESASMSGSLEFKLSDGSDMPVNRISSRNLIVEEESQIKEDLVAYTMMNSYTSGQRFRFFMNISKEAYIYAFATDLTGKINRILPFDDMTSTHVGSNSVIAFPSDTKVIKLDDQKGTDYLLVLYSKNAININDLINQMNKTKGGLSSKIVSALGNKLVKKQDIRYAANKVGFDVSTDAPGSIVPLMVEIKHN